MGHSSQLQIPAQAKTFQNRKTGCWAVKTWQQPVVFVKVNDRIIAIRNVTVHISQLHSFPVFGPVLLSSVSVYKQ